MPACGPFSCWGAGADFLVRWAQKFDSAEQLGERLRRRYQRQQQRQGIGAEAETRTALTNAAARITLRPHARDHDPPGTVPVLQRPRSLYPGVATADRRAGRRHAGRCVPESVPAPSRTHHRGAGRATPVMTIPR